MDAVGAEVSQRGFVLRNLTVPFGKTDQPTAKAKLNEIRTTLEK